MAIQNMVLFALAVVTARTASAPTNHLAPYRIPPSSRWDGPDGPWATFDITVGSNKTKRLPALPGLSFSILLLPVASTFCNSKPFPEDCTSRIPVQSTSWQPLNHENYSLALDLSRISDNNTITLSRQAQFAGLDSVSIGYDTTAAPMVAKQVIAGVASLNLHTNLLGLSDREMNVSGELRSTFLSSLQKEGKGYPSTSFSYTAGSFSRNGTPPSLILGGYDASRLNPSSTLQVSLEDKTHISPLVVNLSSISFNGLANQWPDPNFKDLSPIAIPIDPAFPQIWLPVSVCALFEVAFGLEWNDVAQLYLVDSTAHERMLKLNASVSFSLHSSRGNDTVMTFTLPYSAFDLITATRVVDASGFMFTYQSNYYFPLKRAASFDQYVLGRPFLQETLISVDYEAAYFNISQAVFKLDTPSNIETIQPLQPRQPQAPPPSKKPKKLAKGAYIAISVCIASLAFFTGFMLVCRRNGWWPFPNSRKATAGEEKAGAEPFEKAELPPDARPWIEIMSLSRAELPAGSIQEVWGASAKAEMAAEKVECEMAAERDECEMPAENTECEMPVEKVESEPAATKDDR